MIETLPEVGNDRGRHVPAPCPDYVSFTAAEVEAFGRVYMDQWPARRMHCSDGAFKWRFSVPAQILPRRHGGAEQIEQKATKATKGAEFEACPYRVGQRLFINEPVWITGVTGDSFCFVRADSGVPCSVLNEPRLAETARQAWKAAHGVDVVYASRVPWPGGVIPRVMMRKEFARVMEIGEPQLRSAMGRADFDAEGSSAVFTAGALVFDNASPRMGWLEQCFRPKFPEASQLVDSWVWPVFFQRVTV
jgi:hypothetical protein